MPESFSEQHLAQLEERWRRDPASRVFLQLAEELRRGRRLERAIEILRAGLLRHPNYLSAQVSLGRCLLELGDPLGAARSLERAVGQDPAQVVASRLLIESYIALGDAGQARSRLDFYRLFSERDEEFRALEARVRALESAPAHAASAREPFGALRTSPAPALLFAPAPRLAPATEQPFGPLPPPPAAADRFLDACRREAIFAVAEPNRAASPIPEPLPTPRATPRPAPPPAATPPPAAMATPVAMATTTVAPPPAPVEATPTPPRPWWAALPGPADAPPLTPPPDEPSVAAAEPPWRGPATELALEGEANLFAASFSPREIGAEVERETIEEPFDEVYSAAAAPPPAPPATAASVTLAELYLEQGHLDEAERAFRAVLADRGEHAAARQGLAEVARRQVQLLAGGPETAWTPEAPEPPLESPAGSLSRRKAGALRAYLGRLRRGATARVS